MRHDAMAHTYPAEPITPGTIVRYDNGRGIGPAGPGALGKIMPGRNVLGWAVVYFPFDTWGPHSTYACNPAHLTPVPVDTLTDREHWAFGV